MFKSILLLLTGFFFITASSQTTNKLNVNAGYISMYYKKNNAYNWDDIRPMPVGNFTCKEQPGGRLLLKYNPHDNNTIYNLETKGFVGDLKNVPREIGGMKIKGVYSNPLEPMEFYHVLYYDSSRANCLLLVSYIELGKHITGATCYSDKPINPLREKGIRF